MDRRERLNEPEEALRAAMDGHQAGMWTALPGIVTRVDLEKMTVEVQPSVLGTVTDKDGNESNVPLPVLPDVPIVFPSVGGFALTLPITAGDEVLVVFASRCIDAWWQQGGQGKPLDQRMHDLSDGFAIPGPRSQTRLLPNISPDTAQLRNESGDTFIEIDLDGNIRLRAPTSIILDTPAIVAADGASGASSAQLNGSLVATGDLRAAGGSIGLVTHNHTGVQPGGGNTGGPVG